MADLPVRAQQAPAKCPSCGNENGADAKRCSSCGTFLGPVLKSDKPSEEEVPNHLVLAIVAAGLPLLCATSGALALVAVPVALYAVWQAKSVDDYVKGRDVLAARAASINAQRFSLVAMVLAVVLSIGSFVYQASAMKDVVKRDVPVSEDIAVSDDAPPGEAAPASEAP